VPLFIFEQRLDRGVQALRLLASKRNVVLH
jgi:hypothetical protein